MTTTLLSDIGGTNARFALLSDGVVGPVSVLSVADHPTITAAIGAFLGDRRPDSAVIAAAGPVRGDQVPMINAGRVVDAADLRASFGFRSVHLVNDFAALAWALPALTPADLLPLGPLAIPRDGTLCVVGPGTGFGLAALIREPGGETALATEGGHASIAAEDKRDEAIIRVLRDEFGQVSIERILSGPGLLNLYHAVGLADGLVLRERTNVEIVHHALAGTCEASVATLNTFCAFLGSVAGNAALSFGAMGGVYIGGGIPARFPEFLAASPFRQRFEAKGRMRHYVEAIPTALITHRLPAFVGLARLAQRVAHPRSHDVQERAADHLDSASARA